MAALAQVSGVHELASGPDGRAADVLAAGRDPSFWDRARSLAVLTRPMSEFSSWIRGCECHEADRMAGRAVTCQWAGCRARSLASRVACVLQELESKRGHLLGQGPARFVIGAHNYLGDPGSQNGLG